MNNLGPSAVNSIMECLSSGFIEMVLASPWIASCLHHPLCEPSRLGKGEEAGVSQHSLPGTALGKILNGEGCTHQRLSQLKKHS